MEQAVKQLEDLVIVWAVVVSGKGSITREMVLIKVSTVPPTSAYSPLGQMVEADDSISPKPEVSGPLRSRQ